jgi:hypothetical protein
MIEYDCVNAMTQSKVVSTLYKGVLKISVDKLKSELLLLRAAVDEVPTPFKSGA